MRFLYSTAAVAVLLSSGACANPTGSTDLESPRFSAQASEMIPVEFEVTNVGFIPVQFEEHGNSGRSRNKFCLDFNLVEGGDLTGSYLGCLAVNDPSPKTASQGIDDWFSTAHTYSGVFDVCMASLDLCGTFEGGTSTLKIYPLPRGVEGPGPNVVSFGTDDFEGMKLQGILTQCGDNGCFVGTLQVPGGP